MARPRFHLLVSLPGRSSDGGPQGQRSVRLSQPELTDLKSDFGKSPQTHDQCALGCPAIHACWHHPDSPMLRLETTAELLPPQANMAALKGETQLITCSLAADIPDIWSGADFISRTGHLGSVG